MSVVPKDLLASWPSEQYPTMLPVQRRALELLEKESGSTILELPTGSGKTAIGYTFLKAMLDQGLAPLFYVAPTKTLVDQVKSLHPDVTVIYGRSEYRCLYYKGEVTAEEAPCSMLGCPHRVNRETGETEAAGVEPCPYLAAKWQAKQGGIVVCTTAFYLFTQLFSKDWDTPAGLVLDEAHRTAQLVRSSLSYEITDYHLARAIELLEDSGANEEAGLLKGFLARMIAIIRAKKKGKSALLEAHEVQELLVELYKIDPSKLAGKIRKLVRQTSADLEERREILKRLEMVVNNLHRYLRSLEYSLPSGERRPLNFSYAYYEAEQKEGSRVKFRLFIKAYYVSPIIQKLLSPRTLSYSATIGDAEVFAFENGIKAPYHSFASTFPSENTRIYLPADSPNLSVKERSKRDPTRALRMIARGAAKLAQRGIRSLAVVVSNLERQKLLTFCQEEGVEAVSYGNGIKPRQAAEKFKQGEGMVLVGTVANYGEGVDLPKQSAPVIFFLRPGYPSPNDPCTEFEERRYGSMRWKLWNWRVMQEALQVRGRNMRSANDLGATIFVSQQFVKLMPAALPDSLKPAFKRGLKFEQCVEDAAKLVNK